MRVLLDTNFLMDMIRFKADLYILDESFGRYELVTFSSVKDELKSLAKKTTISGRYAKLSLKFIEMNHVHVINSSRRPDNAIIDLAGKDAIAATNDIALRKKLKSMGMRTIYLKSKKHLAIG